MFQPHWRELALDQDSIPLDPDYERYLQFEMLGILHVLVARTANTGRLVGYVFCILNNHLHYAQSRWCTVDMFWLDPAFRKGWNGIKLIRNAESRMRDLGAVKMLIGEKLHFKNGHDYKVGVLLEFLGYAPIETVHAKRLR